MDERYPVRVQGNLLGKTADGGWRQSHTIPVPVAADRELVLVRQGWNKEELPERRRPAGP